eukprot:TRINITY_DN7503_c0_g1_i2.p2 TRINITY_DN7503_c0_g1~~TRINITY_DN7503_c0_g1_i2.p2  ORF type:complete len:460 (+),score=118.88 TRINITY_DN7503_c0_g1_i2:2428-3807(+)
MQGLIGSFLAQQPLQRSEEQCLKKGTGALGGQAVQISQNIYTAGKQVLAMKGAGRPSASRAPAQGKATGISSGPVQAMQTQDAVNVMRGRRLKPIDGSHASILDEAEMMLALGMQLEEVAKLGHNIMSSCLQSDGKDTLKLAAENAKNLKYLEHTLLSNGVDALSSLEVADKHWKAGNAFDFGTDIGTALREIFLNTDTSGKLPEGIPAKTTIMNMTRGFLDGFFGGTGMKATITTEEAPRGVTVDLDRCVKDVSMLESTWKQTAHFYAKQGALKGALSAGNEDQRASELAYAMLELPEALKQCNITADDYEALKDALETMGTGVDVRFTMPGSQELTKSQAVGNMAEAAGSYLELVKHPSSAPEFGKTIGKTMKQLLGSALSQKYFVDEAGHLRKQLSGSVATHFYPVSLMLSAALLLLGVAAMRSRRGSVNERAYLDVEACRSGDLDVQDKNNVYVE